MKIKISGDVCKSMRVGNLGLGTYPSQILRLLNPFSTWESKKKVPLCQINIASSQVSRFEPELKNKDFYNCRKIKK